MNNTPRNININQQNRRINSEEKLVNYIKTQLGSPLITVDVTSDQILQCVDDTFEKFSDWVWESQQNQVFIIKPTAGIRDYILDTRIKAISGISIADTLNGYGTGSGLGMWGGIPMTSIMPPSYVPATDFQGGQSSLHSPGSQSYSATGVAGGVAGGKNTSSSGMGTIEAAWAGMANMQTMQSMFGPSVSYDYNSSNHILRLFEDITSSIVIEASLDYIPNPEYDMAYGHSWIKAYSLNLVKRLWGNNVGKFDSPLVGGSNINYQRLIDEAQSEIDKLEESLINESEAMGMFSG